MYIPTAQETLLHLCAVSHKTTCGEWKESGEKGTGRELLLHRNIWEASMILGPMRKNVQEER